MDDFAHTLGNIDSGAGRVSGTGQEPGSGGCDSRPGERGQ